MASLKVRRRTRVVLAVAVLTAVLVCLLLARRAALRTHFDAPPPVSSLPSVSLPFELPEDLHYVFGWNGMPAATLRMTTSRETDAAGAGVVIEYEIRSLPAIDPVWHVEATGRTLLDATELRPQSSVSRKRSEDKETTYSTTFDWPAGIAKVAVHRIRDGRAKDKSVSLDVGLDIPSAFLAVRSAGAGQSLRIVHGDDAYQVVVVDRGQGPVKLSDGSTAEGLHYEVGVRKLGRAGDEEPAGEADFSSGHLWLAPGTRTPLRLEAQALVGTVYAEPAPASPPEAGR